MVFRGILNELLPLAQVILGLRGAKLGLEKNNKNAHILTVNIAVAVTVSISSQIYAESNTHSSSESSTLFSWLSSIVCLMLQKTNILLTSHHILANWNASTVQRKWQSFPPSSEGSSS